MAKHNLEVEPEEGYELVQVISEEKGKIQGFPFHGLWLPLQKL